MNILSLDGGGLKGIYTLMMLKKIEEEYNIKCCEYFDIIIGTSTGSIIATLLSLGLDIDEIIKIYYDNISTIFSTTKKRKRQKGLFKSIYDNINLKMCINKYTNNITYEDLKTKLIIPTVDFSNSSIKIVKSYEEILKDKNVRFNISDAIISSSSAPGFFDPHLLDGKLYIDGSIYANFPALIAFSEAFKLGINNIEDIKIISIGTGKENVKYEIQDLNANNLKNKFKLIYPIEKLIFKFMDINDNDYGLLSMSKPLFKTTIRTNSEINEYILENILKKENYVRINDVSDNLSLDKIPINLINNTEDLFNNIHKSKLDLFFSSNVKVKRNWFKEIIYKLSKKLKEFSEK